MLPKEWKQVPLHTVAEVRTGLSKNAQRQGATLKRPYLRVANVQDGALDLSDVQEIDVPASQTSRYTLQAGDLLLIEGNGNPENLGRACLWHGQIPDAVHQNHVFAVRTHGSGQLLPAFLELLVQSRYGRDYFLSCAKGSTGLASLNSTQLKGFPVILPPFDEQLRITRVIETWSAAIATTERRLSNSRTQKDALSLIFAWGGRRLNGRSGKVIRQHASDLFTPVSIRRNENAELLSVTQEQGVIPRCLLDRKVVMPEGATDSYKLVEPGDFVISLRSFEGGLEYSKYRGIVSPAYTVLRAKKPICDDFYRHYFKSKDFISRLSVAVIGIRDGKQISYDDFAFLKIPSPSIEVQRKVADVLNEAEHEIELLTKHLETLKVEKRALMADLLTGKRRVRVPDPTAEPEAA